MCLRSRTQAKGRFLRVVRRAVVVLLRFTFLRWRDVVVMRQPPERFGRIMAHVPMPAMLILPFETMWNVARGGTLEVGAEPWLYVPLSDHSREVRLSSFRAGSLSSWSSVATLDRRSGGDSRPQRDARQFRPRRRVLRRVHRGSDPSDAWQLPSNLRDQVAFASPTDMASRTELAEVCVVRLGLKLPAVVDRFDDATEKAYTGWPDRLYLIGVDGRVAYKSKPGPFGSSPMHSKRRCARH